MIDGDIEGLSPKQIRNIHEGMKSKVDPPRFIDKPINEEYQEARKRQVEVFGYGEGRPEITREELDKLFKREEKFFLSVKGLFSNEEEETSDNYYFHDDPLPENIYTPVENRLVASDLISLYHLYVAGGLDRLYSRYEESMRSRKQKLPRGEENKDNIRLQLALDFVDHVRTKNQERDLSLAVREPVTIGFEVEYDDFVNSLLYDYNVLTSELIYSEVIKERKQLDDITDTSSFDEETAAFVEQAKFLREFFRNSDDEYENDLFMSSAESNSQATTPLSNTDRPAFNYSYDGSGVELKVKPTASYKTPLREMLYVYQSGGLDAELGWNIHANISGPKLSREDPQLMDIMLISGAAGYLDPELAEHAIDDSGVIKEKHRKYSPESNSNNDNEHSPNDVFNSDDEDEIDYVYFPFHRAKYVSDHYSIKNYPTSNEDKSIQVVEQRSLLKYQIKDFPILVRHSRFTFLASNAVKAVQMDREHVEFNKVGNVELRDSWNAIRGRWSKLLSDYNIDPLQSNEYWCLSQDAEYAVPRYQEVMSQVVQLSQDDEEFRSRSRELIRDFNKVAARGVKNLVG